MVAIVLRDSALHRTVDDVRPAGSLREQRITELRAVLGGAALGALLPVMQSAQIRSLAALMRLSVERLQTKLYAAGGSLLTAAERRRLTTIGMCTDVTAPQEPARMERGLRPRSGSLGRCGNRLLNRLKVKIKCPKSEEFFGNHTLTVHCE